jgi:hypothetical protein
MMSCVEVPTMPSNDHVDESLALAQELSSLLAAKRPRPVDCHFGERAPRKAKKKRVEKTVRFAEDQVRVFEVEGGNVGWYHEQDYQRIKQENRDTLIAIARAKGKLVDIDADCYCIRGLELQVGITLLNTVPYARQKMVVKRVLDLQEEQRSQNISDTDALREMSRSLSTEDKFKAWRTASVDAFRLS